MAEIVTLTSAETFPNNTQYKVDWLRLDLTNSVIQVHLVGLNGEVKDAVYGPATSPTGASLLSSLNTSNNSAGTSLIKRVYNQLISSGVLSGTVSGSPS